MEIRTMTINDYEAVYALWMSCTGMGLNNLDDSEEGIGRFLQRNPDTCFVAADADRIVGVIIAGNDGRRGYIYHTAVNPEYRKQMHLRIAELIRSHWSCLTGMKAVMFFGKNKAFLREKIWFIVTKQFLKL